MAYESKFKREDIDELFEAILTLKDQEDCYRFFEYMYHQRNTRHRPETSGGQTAFGEKDLYGDRSCHKGVDGYHKQDKQVPGLWSRRLQESAREAE